MVDAEAVAQELLEPAPDQVAVAPAATTTCADSAGKPDVTVHTWRSCTSTTSALGRQRLSDLARVHARRARPPSARRTAP